jgi:hypothetical protein
MRTSAALLLLHAALALSAAPLAAGTPPLACSADANLAWKLVDPSGPGLGLAVEVHGKRALGLNFFATLLYERVGDEWNLEVEDIGDGLGVGLSADRFVTALNIFNWTTRMDVYRYDGSAWPREDTVITVGGKTPVGNCADCIDIDGDTLVYLHGGSELRVRRFAAGTWTDELMLAGVSQPVAAIDGNVLVEGRPLEGPGAVRAYAHNGSSWSPPADLIAPSGVVANFGGDVARSGEVIAVGASDAFAVYRRAGSDWVLEQDWAWDCGTTETIQVSVSGDFLVAANPACSGHAGEAAIYRFDGNLWNPAGALTPCDGVADGRFGVDVAQHGAMVALGAPTVDVPASFELGAMYLFELDAPECADGLDNDGDGDIDLADGECSDRDDFSEQLIPRPCGLGPELALLVPLLAAARRYRRMSA